MPADQVRALLPGAARGACAGSRDYGDADGDGLLEYIDESGHGLANQGWKDSGDAIRFADGRIAAPPVALCEVQGYAYEAAMRRGRPADRVRRARRRPLAGLGGRARRGLPRVVLGA